jgi:hypothetical protein
MSGVADHLSDRIKGWLNRMEEGGDGSGSLVVQGWALREIARINGRRELAERVDAKLGETGANGAGPEAGVVGEYLRQTMREVSDGAMDPSEAFFTILEALVVGEKKAGANRREASALFNWAVTHLNNLEDAAGVAEGQMRWAMRLGRWPAVFCTSVARTAWGDEGEEEAEEEVGAFEAIEVFARRGAGSGGRVISLKELSKRLDRVSWWCLRSDFRRFVISIEVTAGVLKLEVYEGEVPVGGGPKGKTSDSLDGAAVRARLGEREEVTANITKGVAQLRLPGQVDVNLFELRVRRAGDQQWVEIYGSESAGVQS